MRLLLAAQLSVFRGAVVFVNNTTTYDFGSITQGAAPAARTFSVQNDGTDPLTLSNLAVPAGYTITQDLPASLDPGVIGTFTVRLDSTTTGPENGQISFDSNDPTQDPFVFNVTGSVIAAVPQLTVFRGATTFINGASTYDFGSVVHGDPAVARTFSVQNTGTATLTLSNLAVPAGYTITQNFAASLAPGVSDTFTVRLNSTTLGVQNGQISFNDNDPNQNPFILNVTGNVLAPAAPQITVSSSAGPVVNGTSTIDFGSITQGIDSSSETFTVTNAGDAALTLGAISVPTGYTVTKGLAAALDPGASDTLTVRLDNLLGGDKTGDVSFATNDTLNNPFSFHVTGHVSAPHIAVSTNTGAIADGVTTVSFGGIVRNVTTFTKTFTVRNTGDAAMELGPVRVPTGYTVITDLPASLAGGASVNFSVRLDNALAGTKTGAIRFHTNDLDHSPFTFPITGLVKAPILAVYRGTTAIVNNTTTPISFGTLSQGASTATQTYTVKNLGNGPLTLSAVTVPAGFTIVKQPPTTLGPAASSTFIVGLVAGTAGSKSGSVRFTDGDSLRSPFAFAVSGTVVGVLAIFYPSGNLRLVGTNGPDILTFSGSSSSLKAYNRGQLLGTFAGVKKITAYGNGGNDIVNISNLSIPGYLDGGAGNDTLLGGSGSDTIYGGDGNDSIVGGYGVDYLYGGAGDDVLDAVDGTPDGAIDGGSGNNAIRRDPVDPH